MSTDPALPRGNAPLYWLALGAFAVGTEGFMIAGLLPGMASDLSVSVAAAGQLVTAFALAYALSSPVLTALTGNLNRRKLLIASMMAFTLANIVAWAAEDYWQLMGARVLLAFAAGLYVPGANALAGALVAPERRGSALAIVNGGITIAIALGVPLGTFIGSGFGWRMTFAGIAVLAAIATAGLALGLRRDIGTGLPTATLRERILIARQPAVLSALLVTTLWATGAYTLYTYLAAFLGTAAGLTGTHVSIVLFAWGVSAAVGLAIGGRANDRFGSRSVAVPSLASMATAFFGLSAVAYLLPQQLALVPVLLGVIVWGVAAWAFWPAQQTSLIAIAGLKVAAIALSLNASFMYLGFSLGAALGAFTLAHGSAADLGWAGGLCIVASLSLMLASSRHVRTPGRAVLHS